MTIRTRALAGLAASMGAMALAFGSAFLSGGAPSWAPWAAALAVPGALVSTMVLGAAREGTVGRLAGPFAFVFAVLAGGFCVALALGAAEPGDPSLWLGLPPRAAVILYGVGFLPLVVVPLAYALTFDELALREEDWDRIRRHAAGGDGEAAAGGGLGGPRQGPTRRPGTEAGVGRQGGEAGP